LSQVDIMVAALALSMDLTLLTTDLDFEALPDLRVENWLG
jgi:tRNA(fMet)-specific endonuclease VapC